MTRPESLNVGIRGHMIKNWKGSTERAGKGPGLCE